MGLLDIFNNGRRATRNKGFSPTELMLLNPGCSERALFKQLRQGQKYGLLEKRTERTVRYYPKK